MKVTLELEGFRNRLIDYVSQACQLLKSDASHMVDHLIRCEQAGKSCHGLIRIIYTSTSGKFGPYNFQESANSVLEGTNRLFVDGRGSMGYAVMHKLIEKANTIAEQEGMCLITGVGVYPSGALGDWAHLACEQNLGSIVLGGSPARVSAPASSRPILGTNPICVGLPGKPYHFISDSSTSAITHGQLLLARQNESDLPKGVAVDSYGKLTTDVEEVDPAKGLGALQTVGHSHKSFALSMAIELLTSLGGGVPGSKKSSEHGVFCLVFKPERMAHLEGCVNQVLQEWDEAGVRIPGWKSQQNRSEMSGSLTLDQTTYDQLIKCMESI